MSKMNANAKSFTPKGNTPPKPPKAPPMPGPSKTQQANTKLNADEGGGRHSREKHVGKSDTFLKNRGITTATSFQTAHDQNKVVGKVLGTNQINNLSNQAKNASKHKDMKITGGLGRTAPIARVAQGGQTFNAKVTETTMVMQKGTGKVLTTYPSKFTPLPKPATGPSLKPTTKANVKDIATGAQGLRKVGAPAPKPIDHGNRKQFKSITKNAK